MEGNRRRGAGGETDGGRRRRPHLPPYRGFLIKRPAHTSRPSIRGERRRGKASSPERRVRWRAAMEGGGGGKKGGKVGVVQHARRRHEKAWKREGRVLAGGEREGKREGKREKEGGREGGGCSLE